MEANCDNRNGVATDYGQVVDWSEGALSNIGIENALRIRHGLLRPGGSLVFTDAVWIKENVPDEAWWDDFHPSMQQRIEECGSSALGTGTASRRRR